MADFNLKQERAPRDVDVEYPEMDYGAIAAAYFQAERERGTTANQGEQPKPLRAHDYETSIASQAIARSQAALPSMDADARERIIEKLEQIAERRYEGEVPTDIASGINTLKQESARLNEVLTERYSALRDEIASVETQTPGDAMAAANYYRGRADELNHLRNAVVGQDETLSAQIPEMDLSEIEIGYREAAGPSREAQISR